MTNDLREFPPVLSAVQDGIRRGLHTAVQIYVAVQDTTILDCGYGTFVVESSADGSRVNGSVVDQSDRMLWRSAGKPLTAALIMKQVEQGRISLQTPLAELLTEAAETDKAAVTIAELLTHVSGFPSTETGWPAADWDTSIRAILSEPRELPIGTAAYHPQSSWFLLGEILRRLLSAGNDVDFPSLLRSELLLPLGMRHTSCGLPTEQGTPTANRIPTLYDRDKGKLVESKYNEPLFRTRPAPGGSLRGPVRELGSFYRMLCRGGLLDDGTRFMESSTIAQMTARHRVHQYDQTLQHVVDFGLGLIIDSNHHGADTVPYGFGKYCSSRTFGHGGSQCAMGFCDPERQLVVAWAANGFCGEGQHQRRNRAINEAIYQIV